MKYLIASSQTGKQICIFIKNHYLDIIKDRLYTGKTSGQPRRSSQTALYYILEALVRWLAPILSFTSDEIWQHMPGERGISVFLSTWFTLPVIQLSADLDLDFWDSLLNIRMSVNKALETARNTGILGSSLEAHISIYAQENLLTRLSRIASELHFVLMVSKVSLYPIDKKPENSSSTDLEGLYIWVAASTDPKCERCWNLDSSVDDNSKYPKMCGRCVLNVEGMGEERQYA